MRSQRYKKMFYMQRSCGSYMICDLAARYSYLIRSSLVASSYLIEPGKSEVRV